MMFEVIGTIDASDDHGSPIEVLERVNAELGGEYRILTDYEFGQGNQTTWYLVAEVDQ